VLKLADMLDCEPEYFYVYNVTKVHVSCNCAPLE
jgi:hypothetical protein